MNPLTQYDSEPLKLLLSLKNLIFYGLPNFVKVYTVGVLGVLSNDVNHPSMTKVTNYLLHTPTKVPNQYNTMKVTAYRGHIDSI